MGEIRVAQKRACNARTATTGSPPLPHVEAGAAGDRARHLARDAARTPAASWGADTTPITWPTTRPRASTKKVSGMPVAP